MEIECADHLLTLFDKQRFKKTIKRVIRALSPHKNKFDSIVCLGASGLIVPPICLELNKNMIVVRKQNEKTHSRFPVEGKKNLKNYVFLDDILESGGSASFMLKQMKLFNPDAVCQGLFFYSGVPLMINEHEGVPVYLIS